MKTTLDIHDELLARAKRHARESGQPLRAVVGEGLRRVLSPVPQRGYTLADLRTGDPTASDPLERYSWPDLRELIYGDPDPRRGRRAVFPAAGVRAPARDIACAFR